ncbi:oligosaccharyltransferase subunit ribophorin ii protein [Lasallia pustulata]|uniref:Oligosaccharyltransferase subunit ribophorin ii protein n=1 Tax=Lasallia pustulata TaxID=136370 RepID=A0A1W5CSF1_9LECA|nr:oligosaccharyltransferase subunit ribophorin ii protein [Lasallia pustulata]
MQLQKSLLVYALLAGAASLVTAASSWGFDDATISVQAKGAGVSGGSKEKLIENKALSQPIQLGASDTLKILLTAQEDKRPKRPHQAFLQIMEPTTGLGTSYALAVRENGKGKIELTHKDIPSQLLTSSTPLSASLVIGSFGSSKPYNSRAFDLSIKLDSAAPSTSQEKPLRYGKLPEIHHIFRSDPKSPPKVISIFFTGAVIAALPVLLITWLSFGANLSHLSKAIGSSPLSHALFFGSILAMEGIFFMYYTSWNLFQTLPAAVAVGSVTFLSGSRALTEVQERRLTGLR